MSNLEREEICPCCRKPLGIHQIYRHMANARRGLQAELELEAARVGENLDQDIGIDMDVDIRAGSDLGADDVNNEGMYRSILN
jgi:hypothetical protein